MSTTFAKHIENFTCSNCNTKVVGTGYTNHCPNCLYSKHVDNSPGDRANPCHGLMIPIGFETKNGKTRLLHRCQKCGITKPCKTSPADNLSVLLQLP